MKKRYFRTLLVPFSLLVIFLFSVFLLFSFHKDSRLFTELTTELFKNELVSNTLNMHYTVARPKDYGIYSYTAALPVYSQNQELASQAQLENYLHALSTIQIEKLSYEDAYTYNLLTDYLESEKHGASFLYYEEPLSPSSGMQSQLPILLAEYTFRSERDVQDYLKILESSAAYFSGLITYEKEKAAAGLFMADYSAEKVRHQCTTIMNRESLENGTHFLQTSFSERLQLLIDNKILSQKKADAYANMNNSLLCTVMLPTYESLANELFLLEGKGQNKEGLFHYPKGAEYYEYLVQKSTGSPKNIEEIKKLLYTHFDEEYQLLQSLYRENSTLVEEFNVTTADSLFPLKTPEEMLCNLEERMSSDFPALPILTQTPSYTVKEVSESLEDFLAPAFYLTPPLDDAMNNVIYINPKNQSAGVELYTTLAHEGYPGHLYQSVYHLLCAEKHEENPVRELLWYGGYLEGWGLYTEFISYDYAAEIMDEKHCPTEAAACRLEKQNRSLLLCLYSILDVAIHYDGVSYSQVEQLLKHYGITDTASIQSIYEYIVEEPGNYLKYYLGYLEILELKEKARTHWGTGYNDLRFHQFYLEAGPSDFENLTNRLLTSVSAVS